MTLYTSELQEWIDWHGGEENLKLFMKSSRRRRSILSNVNYKESCKDIYINPFLPLAPLPSPPPLPPKKKKTKRHWIRSIIPPCILARLDAKKNKIHPIIEKDLPARYPLAVEKAIYRISHLRLDQPRPLRHHVVISNMLFQHTNLFLQQQQQQQQIQPPYTFSYSG
ncbi:hypothetical protein INT47_007181 [Mucor saturninus]|uniref:Protein Zds1 C-terminal domain-containing protein n=1 Tax=Mucor saturninus TaxID=64648 RepID=A0A8H7R961_9FUNG|nr:hypothetical protein INT47_007181 [Mucor saturninus]